MLALCQATCKQSVRRGAVAFESLLILPLFLLVVVAAVGVADLVVTEQLVDEASGRAARTAALGGSEEQVKESVRAVLGAERAKHVTIHVGPVRRSAPSEHDTVGSTGRDAVPPGGLIEVRIEIEARHATTTRLAPVSGTELLVGRTVMQRE